MDVVLHWLKLSWHDIAAEWGGDVAQDPTVLDYHLHIHLPGLQVSQTDSRPGCVVVWWPSSSRMTGS